MNRLEISKQVRRKIHYYIKRNPGSHYSQIMKRLNLSSGRLSYHILKLEEVEKIFVVYEGYWKRSYPISMKGEIIPNPLTQEQMKIYNFIKKHPGLTYESIVKKFGKTRQSFYYHIKKLMKMNLLRRERIKGKHHFYVNEEAK